jgi:hypothetical protein
MIFMKTRLSEEWRSDGTDRMDWVTLIGECFILMQALSLLKHLESYRRISPPVDLEYQYMLEHVITLPSAAQARLPFHLILFGTAQNFWKILCMFMNFLYILLNSQQFFFLRQIILFSFSFQLQSSVRSHSRRCS